MERLILKITVLLIAVMFIGTSFLISETHDYNSATSGNRYVTSMTGFTQSSIQKNSGYVKCTLYLLNNTLIDGNFVNTLNGLRPSGAAFDSFNGFVYVTNSGSDSVSVINGITDKVIANVSVGSAPIGAGFGPSGAVFDSSNGFVYVTNSGSDSVSVINGTTNKVIANISVGSNPHGAVFDSSNGFVYVTNFYSGTVSIIDEYAQESYTVTFTESGLPSGSTWYVNMTDHDSGTITGSSYFFSLANGSYSYTISISDKTYSPSPYSGSFTVNGANVSESVAFSEVTYVVTFIETGLPSGTSWSVTFNGTTLSSTTNTISFTAANGTYSYSIGSISDYKVSPSSVSITVNGKNVSQSITFTSSSPPPPSKLSSPSGISSTELYIIIGVVIAAAVIGMVSAEMRRRK